MTDAWTLAQSGTREQRAGRSMSHREEFEKALDAVERAADDDPAVYAMARAEVLRLYDEASRLSVSPPKFAQEDVEMLRHFGENLGIEYLRSLADRISSTLAPTIVVIPRPGVSR